MSQRLTIAAVTRKRGSASFTQRIAANVPLLAQRGIDVTLLDLPKSQREQRQFLTQLGTFDAVWWQRHLLMPWWLPRLRKHARCIVFDFDDPLWLSSRNGGTPSWSRRLRMGSLLRKVDAVFCANEYLAEHARRYCQVVHVVPMPVDVPPSPPTRTTGPVELLWIGSAATQPYLDAIQPTLERVGQMRPGVRLRLVAHRLMKLHFVTVDYRPWSEAEQFAALDQCHIGLCPMPDTAWTRGKSPYKVLQYMAYAMSWVGSAVGQLIAAAEQSQSGLTAADSQAWATALTRLIDDTALRHRMGLAGRTYIEAHHRRDVLADHLARLWREIVHQNSHAASGVTARERAG